MDSYYFTAQCYESLKNELSDASFKDGNLLVNWIRTVKSTKELEYMKMAGKILENVMSTAYKYDYSRSKRRRCCS